MSDRYQIFGSEMSPYSVKVRAYARYKAIPHAWVPRRAENDEAYRKIARLPLIPAVATPEGEGLQDSTPIIEYLEPRFPEPSIHPDAPELAFLSALVEEFGDEWGNKLMFHHRWWDDVDQRSVALILARLSLPFGAEAEVAQRAAFIRERMTGRGGFVGSSVSTAPLITRYLFELVDLLQAHLAERKYLFGARPAFGDFGLAPQLFEASLDPTASSILRARGPSVLDWCYRMNEPRNEGPFETWEQLQPTLEPLIAYVGRYFLPWSQANAEALAAGRTEFSVELPGGAYAQAPQKYHARSLAALREKYAAAKGDPKLDAILRATGCTPYLG
jgi:glutathione S-transferase